MRILYYNEGENPAEWLPSLKTALPEAEIRLWQPGDNAPADYALVWNPPASLFQNRTGLKAIFNLAAGVDSLLAMSHALVSPSGKASKSDSTGQKKLAQQGISML